ncbi:hypothetical protein L1887_50599 [Cichorium endivia]|nr:hypothetical protein L1887_50599 [Cichorium endivia]
MCLLNLGDLPIVREARGLVLCHAAFAVGEWAETELLKKAEVFVRESARPRSSSAQNDRSKTRQARSHTLRCRPFLTRPAIIRPSRQHEYSTRTYQTPAPQWTCCMLWFCRPNKTPCIAFPALSNYIRVFLPAPAQFPTSLPIHVVLPRCYRSGPSIPTSIMLTRTSKDTLTMGSYSCGSRT